MKTISVGLLTHIAKGGTTLALCARVTCTDTTVYGFSTHDQPLVIDGLTYQGQTGIEHTAITASDRLNVDNTEVVFVFSDDEISVVDLRAGKFDRASVLFFLVNWADLSMGKILLPCSGWLGEVTVEGIRGKAEMRSLQQALAQQYGYVYTPDCTADLGDARCKVDLTSPTFSADATVVTVVTDRRVFTASGAGLSAVDAWYTGGRLLWSTGPNAGIGFEVKTYVAASKTFTLFLPTAFAITAGDTAHVEAGCDKLLETCRLRFANQANFRGYGVYVPGTDQALRSPDAPN